MVPTASTTSWYPLPDETGREMTTCKNADRFYKSGTRIYHVPWHAGNKQAGGGKNPPALFQLQLHPAKGKLDPCALGKDDDLDRDTYLILHHDGADTFTHSSFRAASRILLIMNSGTCSFLYIRTLRRFKMTSSVGVHPIFNCSMTCSRLFIFSLRKNGLFTHQEGSAICSMLEWTLLRPYPMNTIQSGALYGAIFRNFFVWFSGEKKD